MIHDRVWETNVFQRYTSLLCVAGTPSFHDIFSLLMFYEVYKTHDKRLFKREQFFFTLGIKRQPWSFF